MEQHRLYLELVKPLAFMLSLSALLTPVEVKAQQKTFHETLLSDPPFGPLPKSSVKLFFSENVSPSLHPKMTGEKANQEAKLEHPQNAVPNEVEHEKKSENKEDFSEPKPPKPEPPKIEDEVHILGTRLSSVSGSVHQLSEKQLQRFRYDDPHAVLVNIPGVYVRGEDGFGLRPNVGIRGVSSDRSKKVLWLEDGIPSGPAPYSAPAAYYVPFISRMKNVRVMKGAAAIVYGPQTIGGVIDLITRTIPASPQGFSDVAFGQYGYNKLYSAYGFSTEKLGVYIEGLHLGSSGFKTLDKSQGGDVFAAPFELGTTGFSRNEWMIKGSYIFDPKAKATHELRLKLGYSDEDSNETYLGLSDSDFRSHPYRRYEASKWDHMNFHRTQIEISHEAKFSKTLTMTTTAYRHDLDRTWRKVNGFGDYALYDLLTDEVDSRAKLYREILKGHLDSETSGQVLYIGPNHRRFVSQGIQTLVRYTPKTGDLHHAIEYGLKIHYDEIYRVHSEQAYDFRLSELTLSSQKERITADNTAYTTALSMHFFDVMSFKQIEISPGMRVEFIHSGLDDRLSKIQNISSYQVWIPGIGAFYSFTNAFGLLAGVHKGFSPKAPGDNAAKAESSVNYEFGLRYRAKKLRAELIGFTNHYTNLTNTCTFSSGCDVVSVDKQSSVGSALIYGLEVLAEAELKLAKGIDLPLRGVYTYTHTQFLSDYNSDDSTYGNVKKGDELPYVPKHQFVLQAGLETKKLGANVRVAYVSNMREVPGQGEIIPSQNTDAYATVDLSVYGNPVQYANIYLNVRNLFDETHIASRRPFGARPGAPRIVEVGVKLSY